VIAEVNNGGALVKEAIQSVDGTVRVRMVTARKGKALRAEPVQLAYEQHRVHHYGQFPLLEAQMSSWVPGETRKSPDRIDALVYAVGALAIPSSSRTGVGSVSVSRAKSRIAIGTTSVRHRPRARM
jgi:phage terminase large subunit-like protein